jgi:hypothetical protein
MVPDLSALESQREDLIEGADKHLPDQLSFLDLLLPALGGTDLMNRFSDITSDPNAKGQVRDVIRKLASTLPGMESLSRAVDTVPAKLARLKVIASNVSIIQSNREDWTRQVSEALQELIDHLNDSHAHDEVFRLLADSVARTAEHWPDDAGALAEVLDDVLVDVIAPNSWATLGGRLAKAYHALGHHSKSQQLVEQRVELAETQPHVLSCHALCELWEIACQLWGEKGGLPVRLAKQLVEHSADDLRHVGAQAAALVKWDVEKALALADQRLWDERTKAYEALAKAIGQLPDRSLQRYAIFRLIERASSEPWSLQLSVQSVLGHQLGKSLDEPFHQQVRQIVLGVGGFNVLDGSAAATVS